MKTKNILLSLISVLCVFAIAEAHAFDTSAKHAMLIDVETRTVLMDKNSQDRMPTSSMSKVMTMYVVFQAIEDGRLQLDDECVISEKAWRKGGSKMFIEVGKKVKVEDLIRGVIVQSGNDASIALAECLAGNEKNFAETLNEAAADLGMTNSQFANASGWPDPNHYSTAYDLSLLAYHLITDFPQYYHYYSQEEFTFNGIKQKNRNPLLYQNIGADGIKTGHTEIAGYGLMASATVNDGYDQSRRLILVVNGLNSEKARSEESARILRWGQRNFRIVKLFDKGEVVESVPVHMGKLRQAPLVVNADIKALYNVREKESLSVKLRYDTPIKAPVSAGTKIGDVIVKSGDFPEQTYPLYVGQDIEKLNYFSQLIEKARIFLKR